MPTVVVPPLPFVPAMIDAVVLRLPAPPVTIEDRPWKVPPTPTWACNRVPVNVAVLPSAPPLDAVALPTIVPLGRAVPVMLTASPGIPSFTITLAVARSLPGSPALRCWLAERQGDGLSSCCSRTRKCRPWN